MINKNRTLKYTAISTYKNINSVNNNAKSIQKTSKSIYKKGCSVQNRANSTQKRLNSSINKLRILQFRAEIRAFYYITSYFNIFRLDNHAISKNINILIVDIIKNKTTINDSLLNKYQYHIK